MILPDINLLIYAHNIGAPQHEAARQWWDTCLRGPTGVAIPWAVILGLIRICTNSRIHETPMTTQEVCDRIEEWLRLPHIELVNPPANHFQRLSELFNRLGTAGNLTTDVHLAALAMQRGLILFSNDADFSRFQGLKWKNPLEPKR